MQKSKVGDNMVKKNLVKLITILTMIILLFCNYTVYAAGESGDEGGGILTDPSLNPGFWEPTIENDPTLTAKAGTVLQIINTIGIILAVIILILIGLKYMLSSVEAKADFKKALIPYIIGIVLLVASTTIPNVIYQMVNSTGLLG